MMLDHVADLYRKIPHERVECPIGYDEDIVWGAASLSRRGTTTGSRGPSMGHGGRLLETQTCPPASNGDSGRISARKVV